MAYHLELNALQSCYHIGEHPWHGLQGSFFVHNLNLTNESYGVHPWEILEQTLHQCLSQLIHHHPLAQVQHLQYVIMEDAPRQTPNDV